MISTTSPLSVIVLIKDEERHLRRFFEKLRRLQFCELVVIDSGSSDNSISICQANGAIVIEKDWLGNQALQFNWAIENVDIKGKWILRLDADEYLLDETVDEINSLLFSKNPSDAYILKRRHYVYGSWIKQGMYPAKMVRLFRKGFAKYQDNMLMDEHLVVNGSVSELSGDFVDESLLSRKEWFDKHVEYARREAEMALDQKNFTEQKKIYYRLPPFIRPFLFFGYNVVLRGGFLNGKKGLKWYLFQVLFYRSLVDMYIYSMKDTTYNK